MAPLRLISAIPLAVVATVLALVSGTYGASTRQAAAPLPAPKMPLHTRQPTTLVTFSLASAADQMSQSYHAAEFQLRPNFAYNFNVAMVHEKDWDAYQYSVVSVEYRGGSAQFVVMDKCVDANCNGCCTLKMQTGGTNFLLALDSAAFRRSFDASNIPDPIENFFEPTASFFQVQSYLDRTAIAQVVAQY